MSASMQQFYWGKAFSRGWKMSNNAKWNKAINGGRTAAQQFYLLWSY
ncbi:hypothetical protein [Avibacterium paragallinarum]|uniref:Uncharacterized protein n=1 Tax=Avibacterium paragallinarum TaxID=728 RepID=A0A380X3B7_AVIPA|nr:hypothetical protein [Avibacterium paragallinarum]SUU97745.1 Uncharacterised protein [Avibacterium paragallinarum]SUU98644.1 Uncharacterised protein [Avibacterium paragallinarum]SUV40825.1 Uncharacterised protein [Avibacterium paragallinarum]